MCTRLYPKRDQVKQGERSADGEQLRAEVAALDVLARCSCIPQPHALLCHPFASLPIPSHPPPSLSPAAAVAALFARHITSFRPQLTLLRLPLLLMCACCATAMASKLIALFPLFPLHSFTHTQTQERERERERMAWHAMMTAGCAALRPQYTWR